MLKRIILFFSFALLFSCTGRNEDNRQHAGINKQDTFSAPRITIIADLPDSLKPKVTLLDTAPKPRIIQVPTKNTSYTYIDNNGVKQNIALELPVRKMLPVLLDAKGDPVKDSAGNTFIMGTGGKGNFTNFTTDDGLALDAISCSIMDSLGNLWFGTFGGGVSRYDGKSFTNITVAHGLANNAVYCIAEDNKGNIWFGTYGGGVSRYDGRSFTSFNTNHGLADDKVFSIAQDRSGNLWFGTAGGGVSRFDGKTFKTFSTADGLAANTVITIAEDITGNIWFGTIGGGASKYNPSAAKGTNPFTTFSPKDGLAADAVVYIFPDKSGNIWLGTYGGGVSRYDGKNFKNFSVAQGLAGNMVVCIAQDDAGDLWFATQGGGVSCYNGKTFTSYAATQGLASNDVKSITIDRAGNLWFGTFSNGLSRYNGKAFTNFSSAQGLANNTIYSIGEDKNGNLWFGTHGGGACMFDGVSFTTFSAKQGLADNVVSSVIQDKKGNIWLGTRNGLSCFDGRAFTNFTNKQGLLNNSIATIAENNAGNMWVGTLESGVSLYNLSTAQDKEHLSFTTYTTKQGLAGNDVQSIAVDKWGNAWFGSLGGGISRFDGKTFTNFTEAQGLAHNNVYCITQDKAGNMWFATAGGLSVLSAAYARDAQFPSGTGKNVFSSFTQRDGLPDNFVTQVLQMPDGKMAVGTNQGITLFMPTGDLGHLRDVSVFNYATGCPVKDVIVGHHAMTVDSKGIIWAGTGSEKTVLVRFNPSHLVNDTNTITPVIKSIKVNEENIAWQDLSGVQDGKSNVNTKLHSSALRGSIGVITPSYSTDEVITMGRTLTEGERDSMRIRFGNITFDSISRFYPVPHGLTLPYRNNNITIEFNAVETGKHELVNYRYMLEGYDNDWSPVLKKTSATYGNIREGDYTFKLKAQGPNGLWSEPVTYTFRVLPPWYRTWWAYIAYATLFVLLLLLFSKWRERHLRMEKELLEKTVEKRTEELVQKNEIVEKQKAEVESEKKRSEALLLNILPEEIADELRTTGTTKAKQFDNVTVLFTDFVNFTEASGKISPQELINELHECFRAFDEITQKYNIEKIKTIGDAYLAAAGLPTADPEHAYHILQAAIEINDFMRIRKAKPGSHSFDIRIGIHSGSVIAGVVGVRKFAYDIWGDTVNMAARMEQSSEEGRINISETTYQLVKDRFSCTYRGEREVKGKGLQKMYYVS